jgi:DNA-binding CsgD family transcriptional regulator
MARSNRLPLHQVRLALRLVGECRDLGHDLRAWLGHAADGLRHLLRAKVMSAGITRPEGFRLYGEADLILHAGWEPGQERVALQFHAREGHLQDPTFQSFQRISKPNITLRPVQLIPRRAFRASEAYAQRTALGIEDFMFSQRASSTGRATVLLSPQRAHRDAYFGAREERLLALFHDELARLVGTVLSERQANPLADLPPRLRQTLAALLEGDAEKQVALRLGLSRHTVHEYVTRLYRRFGVQSRAELLALCLRRRIGHA